MTRRLSRSHGGSPQQRHGGVWLLLVLTTIMTTIMTMTMMTRVEAFSASVPSEQELRGTAKPSSFREPAGVGIPGLDMPPLGLGIPPPPPGGNNGMPPPMRMPPMSMPPMSMPPMSMPPLGAPAQTQPGQRERDEELQLRLQYGSSNNDYDTTMTPNMTPSQLVKPLEKSNGRGQSAATFAPEPPRILQGGNTRETWSNPYQYEPESSQEVNLYTDGRPLVAEVEVWEGPSNIPTRMRVYTEDGRLRPFRAHVDSSSSGTMSGTGTSITVRNTGPMAFPLQANVYATPGVSSVVQRSVTARRGTNIQGGNTLRTFPIATSVGAVLVELESFGMPIQAVLEVWQGPGNARQVVELYAQDGMQRSCSVVVDTPSGFGDGSTIAIRNVGPVEFPFSVQVTPYRPQLNQRRQRLPQQQQQQQGDYRMGPPPPPPQQQQQQQQQQRRAMNTPGAPFVENSSAQSPYYYNDQTGMFGYGNNNNNNNNNNRNASNRQNGRPSTTTTTTSNGFFSVD